MVTVRMNTKGLWGGALFTALLLTGCPMVIGPSEEHLNCLHGCAQGKDQCMLNAMTPPAISECDAQSSACSETCPQ